MLKLNLSGRLPVYHELVIGETAAGLCCLLQSMMQVWRGAGLQENASFAMKLSENALWPWQVQYLVNLLQIGYFSAVPGPWPGLMMNVCSLHCYQYNYYTYISAPCLIARET